MALHLLRALPATADGDPPALDPQRFSGQPVAELRFVGNQALGRQLLAAAVYTESGSGWFLWHHESLFDAREFERDGRRLAVLHERRGFPAAQIDSRVVPGDDGLIVTFTIDEGPPLLIGSTTVEGWPVELTPLDSWSEPLPVVVGGRWRRPDVEQAGRRLADSLLARGHWRVQIEHETRRDSNQAAVTFFVDPGPIYWLRRVELVGAGRVPRWLIEENLGLRSGGPFVEAELAAARRRLAGLRQFRRVKVETAVVGLDSVDATYQLVPGGQRSRAFGVGYATEERLRLRAYWSDRNFLGGARSMAVEGRISKLGGEIDARFVQPRFPTRRFRSELHFELEQERETNYTQDSARLEGWLRRPWWAGSDLGFGVAMSRYDLEADDLSELTDLEEESHRVAELLVQLRRDTANDPLGPDRGSRFFLELAGADQTVLGEAGYGAANLDCRWYQALGSNHVLALRQKLGIVVPHRPTGEVPVWRRQFGGGASDMRSHERHTLGPLDSGGNGVGGELLSISVLEWRLFTAGLFGGALFVEGGGLWDKVADAGQRGWNSGIGGGLRVRTPVGPLRVDLGYKVGSYDRSLKRLVYHFSIGEAF